MPSEVKLPIFDIVQTSVADVRAIVSDLGLPGFLFRRGDRLQLVAQDQIDDLAARVLAAATDVGEPVLALGAVRRGEPYAVVDLQEWDGPPAPALGAAVVRLTPPPRIGFAAASTIQYNCPAGHPVLVRRLLQPGDRCPQHTTLQAMP